VILAVPPRRYRSKAPPLTTVCGFCDHELPATDGPTRCPNPKCRTVFPRPTEYKAGSITEGVVRHRKPFHL
jgi:hypothetical protein